MNEFRELDVLVSRKVMGIEVNFDHEIGEYIEIFSKSVVPFYSTDKEAARAVLKKVTGRDGEVTNPLLLVREVLDLYI